MKVLTKSVKFFSSIGTIYFSRYLFQSRSWVFIGFCSQILLGYAQEETDTTEYQLAPVQLSVNRWEKLNTETHLAISQISEKRIQQGQQQLSFNESLNYVPGVFALNPDNFAQDVRVSIRGFGARSAFGIRGIKLLVDGIPETTPDGQAQVDNLDLGMAQQIEVIRGPASGMYGNASGGVISVVSESPTDDPFAEIRLSGGSYGFQRYQLKTGNRIGKLGYILHGSYTRSDGYRDYSDMQNYLFNGKLKYDLDSLSALTLILNYVNSPEAEDPGAITLSDVRDRRQQAREQNVRFEAGESVIQHKVGLKYDRFLTASNRIQLNAYHINRDFDNKLPFENGGRVVLNRNFYGFGGMYRFDGNFLQVPYRLILGVDAAFQRDDRERFNNLEGDEGNKVFDQLEIFNNVGVYLKQEWQIASKLILTGDIRWDQIAIEADDRFIADGDDSGQLDYTRFSPIGGLVFTPIPAINLYTNFATSFETPTLSELSANPDNTGGFNEALSPQQSYNFEVGAKGIVRQKLSYEWALFRIRVMDELVPFELEAFPGRTFFRNAGESLRNGVEVLLQYQLSPGWSTYATYTYSDFTYETYETSEGDFTGNTLPGIPTHTGLLELRYQKKMGWYGALNARYVGELYADDANTVQDQEYWVLNMRMGYIQQFANFILEPFMGINNLTDSQYNANVRLNAFGSRYFEPAAGWNIFGGIRFRWNG